MSVEASEVATEPQQRKPLRADAQRNYDKILATAREVFAEHGTDASLDEIAKRAGVGAGTLYRHFPNRESLVDAMMQKWASQVEADAETLVASGESPRAMLTAWFDRFVDNVGVYRGAAAKVTAAMDDPSSPIYRKCQVLARANERVVEAARERGGLREGVNAQEVLRLVSGVAYVKDQSGLDASAYVPMMAIILDGVLADPR